MLLPNKLFNALALFLADIVKGRLIFSEKNPIPVRAATEKHSEGMQQLKRVIVDT